MIVVLLQPLPSCTRYKSVWHCWQRAEHLLVACMATEPARFVINWSTSEFNCEGLALSHQCWSPQRAEVVYFPCSQVCGTAEGVKGFL